MAPLHLKRKPFPFLSLLKSLRCLKLKGSYLPSKRGLVCFLLCAKGLCLLSACAFDVPLRKDKTTEAAGALDCPVGYIEIPKMSGYTDANFCVAKYEMKVSGSSYISKAGGLPARSDCRSSGSLFCHKEILAACQNIGENYDLITNAEWQTIAKNIESVSENWDGGEKGKTSLNVGNASPSLGSSTTAIIEATENALEASEKDTEPCAYLSFAECSQTQWHFHRRTHQLSNGVLIWDFAGNVWEFVKDTLPVGPPISALNDDPLSASGPIVNVNDVNYPSAYNLEIEGEMQDAKTIQVLFGSKVTDSGLTTLAPHGGLGEIRFQTTPIGGNLYNLIVRGGGHNKDSANSDQRIAPGPFATFFTQRETSSTLAISTGFRCSFHPPTDTEE